MAKEGMPVNKDLIAWARKRSGLTLEEAAEKFANIAAWEAGASFPSYPQLEKLADEFTYPTGAIGSDGSAVVTWVGQPRGKAHPIARTFSGSWSPPDDLDGAGGAGG